MTLIVYLLSVSNHRKLPLRTYPAILLSTFREVAMKLKN